jgi:hypothetical protein
MLKRPFLIGNSGFQVGKRSHEARVFPSWNRRGGCALKKKDSLRSGADGVVSRDECFAMHFCNMLRN